MITGNNFSIIVFSTVFCILSYFAGHKDGQNDDFSLGIMFIFTIFFMILGAGIYHTYMGFLK